MSDKADYLEAAHKIIISLGLPRAQQNERSAVSLLALLNLMPGKPWAEAGNPLVGITPIMDWAREHYEKEYAPNTRETFRRQTMHQFCDAGLALYNPDKPDRPVNSPKAVYQIEPDALALVRSYGSKAWHDNLTAYLAKRETLIARYAKEREQNRIPVEIAPGKEITLSPGEHSELIRAIIEDFAPRFAPGSVLVYVGDTGEKWGYFDAPLLAELGVDVNSHGKMPDVVLHYTAKTGFYWSNLSPAMALSMESDTPNCPSSLPVQRPVWFMSQRSRPGQSWGVILPKSLGKQKFGLLMHHHT